MALFVSDLAFDTEPLLGFSKVGILVASLLCAGGGYYVLRMALARAE
jgi:Na+/H+ antiporter NhaA